jgi:intein-encoded DNA endonuclease-like protein
MDKRLLKKLQNVADQVISAYDNNQSLAEIGKLYGCSPSTVASLLKANNVTRRRKGPRGK